MLSKDRLDGPIPGENFTSDTKNYPWHREPEFTDLDDAIEHSAKKLTGEKAAFGLITMLKGGMDIATAADIFVTSGIGAGKWTPDFGLLMAGPIARIIEMMAKGYGVKARRGWEEDEEILTISYFDAFSPTNEKLVKKAVKAVDVEAIQDEADTKLTPKKGGFMSPPETASKTKQNEMLGYDEESEESI